MAVKVTPELAEEARAAVQSEMQTALDRLGLTAEYLGRKLKQELNAKTTRTQKLKGSPGSDMPKKFRHVTTTGIIEMVRGEDGPEREFSDGESLIQWDEADMGIRQRARMDAHKLRGDYPAEKHEVSGEINHTGSLIDDLTRAKERARGSNDRD